MHLRSAGVSVLLDAPGPVCPPCCTGAPTSARGARPRRPSGRRGRTARPTSCAPLTLLAGNVGATQHQPALRGGPDLGAALGARRCRARRPGRAGHCTAAEAGLTLATHLELDDAGVLLVRHELHNGGATAYALDRLGVVLPVPPDGDRAARPDRAVVPRAAPAAAAAGRRRAPGPATPGTGAPGTTPPCCWWRAPPASATGTDRCTGCTSRGAATRAAGPSAGPTGARCSARPSSSGRARCCCEPGESYRTPDVLAVFSDEGLDGLSRRMHRHVRARPSHPRRPRPVVLNTWEAVYFDHRLDRLTGLADVAASIGVERFVLDDGWFLHRRHDRAGLGDWTVDPDVWPDGLGPLIEHVRGLGMEFGLWVEPEMVNEDSDLYRAHPDWVLQVGDALPVAWRHQQVLDLGVPAAWEHLLERLDALLTRPRHRLPEVGPQPRPGRRRPRRPAGGARPDARGLPAAGRAAPAAPGGGDRVLRLRRRPGRPRHPGAHRPGLGQRHERRARAPDDPALDPAAAAARAGRQPRRAGPGAHHRPHPRPLVPRGDRAVRPLRHRVGRHRAGRRRAGAAGRPGGDLPAAPRRCCTPATSCTPTTRTRRRPCTAWWPPTAPRRCSPTSSWRPGRRRCPDRPGCPAWTARRRTAWRWSTPAVRPSPCRTPHRAGGPRTVRRLAVLPGSFLEPGRPADAGARARAGRGRAPHPGLTAPGRGRSPARLPGSSTLAPMDGCSRPACRLEPPGTRGTP